MSSSSSPPSFGSEPGAVLAREVAEQPEVVARFVRDKLPLVRRLASDLPPFSYVVIAARGSSDHVAEYARYLLPLLWGTPVAPATPSLHTRYRFPPRFDHALVIGISQSGQSPDVVTVLADARAQGRPTLAITNDAVSPLARSAEWVIPLDAGVEVSIAATKTYTCQLAAIALLAAVRAIDSSARVRALDGLPEAMARTLAVNREAAETLARRWQSLSRCLVIARGMNLGTAHEIALKLREVVRIQAQAFSAADFRHGSVALLEPGLPSLVVAPPDETQPDVMDLVQTLRDTGADVVLIGEQDGPAGDGLHLPVRVPGWLAPLVTILPGQQLMLALARARTLDADRPAGLSAKVVRTV